MESTRKIVQDRYFLKILTFWSRFVQKSIFLGIGQFAQFPSSKWRNGSQNQNVLEKLSGIGPFWKFWLFGQSQSSTRSKLFFFFFAGGSDRVKFPGRSGSNQGSRGWRHPWRHAQRARVSAWRVERVAGWGGAWNWRRWCWRCMEACGLSFGPEIFGSCRSEVDGSNGVVSFQK